MGTLKITPTLSIVDNFSNPVSEVILKLTVDRVKAEILEDIKSGLVPSDVENFQDLHLFVDANYYGGFCEDGYVISDNFEFENKVQCIIDEWLKNGRP